MWERRKPVLERLPFEPPDAEVGEVREEALDPGILEEGGEEFVGGGDALGEFVRPQRPGVRKEAGAAGALSEVGDLALRRGFARKVVGDGRGDAVDEFRK
ncbi:MAG: hypothetical protein RLZZ244_147, partial [Verrucomicrobiota bacterium]